MAFSFLDAARSALQAFSIVTGGVHLPLTHIAASDGTATPDDDEAAAGPIFPTAAVYQNTVSEVDNGDIGRVRMSARRAQITSYDVVVVEAFNSGGTDGATDGDIRDTNAHDYDSGDLAIKKNRSLSIINGLDQTVTIRLYDTFTGLNIYNDTLASAGKLILTPSDIDATGSAAIIAIPALKDMFFATFRLRATASGVPASGTFRARIHHQD
jgi:hypothetical protein